MSALLAPHRVQLPPRSEPVDEPVRICFMIDRLTRAGTESQLLALIRTLDRQKVCPTLVLLDGQDDVSQALIPADCPTLALGVRKLASLSAIRASRRLSHFWHEHRPELLQVYFLDSAYFGVPLAKLCGIRHVLRVRNNLGYWLTAKHQLLGRLIRPWVDANLTNSTEGKAALIQRERLPVHAVTVLENGVDTTRFNRLMLPDTSKPRVRVGCVANLRPVKNIDGLLRAAKAAIARYPNLVFSVAGDGEQRTELERLHVELGLGDRFVFRGSVSDIVNYLRTVDIAVLPSHSEGMSNALLEYMAAGRAIIATDVGANRQMIRHDENGLIVPRNNEQAIVEAIARYMANPLRAASYGAAARRHVEAHYSRDVMRRRFEDYYIARVRGTLNGSKCKPRMALSRTLSQRRTGSLNPSENLQCSM